MPSSTYIKRIRAGIGHGLLLLPAVAVVYHDRAGRLLLVGSATSGTWGLPAGQIELGESPHAAARRELAEEGGIHCDDLHLVAAVGGVDFRHTYDNGDEVEYATFVYRGLGDKEDVHPKPSDPEEVAEAALFSPEDAPELSLPYPRELLWPSTTR